MLICIDFQLAYFEAFAGICGLLRRRIEKAMTENEKIFFIYNHTFSLDGEKLGDTREEVIAWGVANDLALKEVHLIQKNFGWISPVMREPINRAVGVAVMRQLIKNKLVSSSEILPAALCEILRCVEAERVGDLVYNNLREGGIALPIIFDGGITEWSATLDCENVEVIGGFQERCLTEMCMFLEAAGINHLVNMELVYSLPKSMAIPDAECDVARNSLYGVFEAVAA